MTRTGANASQHWRLFLHSFAIFNWGLFQDGMREIMRRAGYRQPDWDYVDKYSPTDNHPIIVGDWDDAMAYAKWAGKRLPTEKEWEFAARGGLKNKNFPWGDDESLARDYANYEDAGGKDKWKELTAPAGSFKPNGYGLYDVAGNAWEWCQDWYDND